MRGRATMAMKRRMIPARASGLDFTPPLALCVLTYACTGPNEASTVGPPPSRQLCTKPTNEILELAKVLPTGELQHVEYQRSMPFGVRRMQASASRPSVKTTFAARV